MRACALLTRLQIVYVAPVKKVLYIIVRRSPMPKRFSCHMFKLPTDKIVRPCVRVILCLCVCVCVCLSVCVCNEPVVEVREVFGRKRRPLPYRVRDGSLTRTQGHRSLRERLVAHQGCCALRPPGLGV
jgi:hypothetical protein